MSECNCGTSELGQWMGTVGGQMGDKATAGVRDVWGAARKKFKNWTGFGDYTIHGNSLVGNVTSTGSGQPSIITQGRSTRVVYREYIGEVYTGSTPGSFDAQQFRLNPADPITFPWLSNLAANFDQYKAHGIIFEFKSTATDTSTSTASLGSVIMATDYNAEDPAFTSKVQMLNSAYASEVKTSDSMLHGIECDPEELQRKVFYVSTFTPVGTRNVLDYDMGFTTVATVGGSLPASNAVGSLYVHYDFEFFKETLTGFGAVNRLKPTVYESAHIPAQPYGNGFSSWFAAASSGESIDPYLVFGPSLDLAMNPTTGALRFPRKYAGQTFRVQVYLRQATLPYTAVAGAPGSHFALSVLSTSTRITTRGTANQFADIFDGQGVEPIEEGYGEVYLQIADVVPGLFAEYDVGVIGFAPTSVANDVVLRLQVSFASAGGLLS